MINTNGQKIWKGVEAIHNTEKETLDNFIHPTEKKCLMWIRTLHLPLNKTKTWFHISHMRFTYIQVQYNMYRMGFVMFSRWSEDLAHSELRLPTARAHERTSASGRLHLFILCDVE